jgi:hypothetical protein
LTSSVDGYDFSGDDNGSIDNSMHDDDDDGGSSDGDDNSQGDVGTASNPLSPENQMETALADFSFVSDEYLHTSSDTSTLRV